MVEKVPLQNDPSYIACQQALKRGDFVDLEPGSLVAFHNGEFVGTGTDFDEFVVDLMKQGKGGSLIKEVNVPEETIDILSPFLVPL